MAYIKASDGTELYCTDWGQGPAVVLIHGWPLNGAMWEKQAAFLCENGMRVISYDRRGFGRSGKPWHGYDYDTLADDLSAVLEALDVRDAALAGFSMGGGEVARYLGRGSRGRVTKAVLISSVTPFLLKTADNPEGIDQSVFDGIADKIREDRPAFIKQFGPQYYGRTMVNHTVSAEVLEWTWSMAMQASPRATLASAKAWSSTDFRGDLERIEIPVRVIHGTGDATVPIEKSGRLSARILRNATLSEYEGEPHGLFWTAADPLNAELLEFCRG